MYIRTEKKRKLEKELMEMTIEENKELEEYILDLLKEKEQKDQEAAELRERITLNKRFIEALKFGWKQEEEKEEIA